MQNINTKAPVTCTKTIVINSCAVEVWEKLTAIDQWPVWNTEISKSKLTGPLEEGSRFQWKTGGMSINSTLHTVTPYTIFGWSGKSLGLLAIHNWHFTELKKQTEVRVEESMEGLLARWFKGMMNKSLEKNMQKWLELLKQECERRERVAA